MDLRQRMLSVSTALLVITSAHGQDAEIPCIEKEQQRKTTAAAGEVHRISSFTPAEAIEKVSPRYPTEAASKGREGWAQLSYVIDEQGNVQDPVVDDFVGDTGFRQRALIALKKWKFKPAMKDGEPTQQCHQKIQFDFLLEGETGASLDFVDRYQSVRTRLDDGDFVKAAEELAVLHSRNTGNRYENAWLWSVDAMLANQLDDKRRERQSLNRAVASSVSHNQNSAVFDSEYKAYMYQRLFMLNAELGFYALALDSARELKALDAQTEQYTQIEKAVARLKQHVASEEPIFASIRIDDDGAAFHTLARHNFGFTQIAGKLDTVEVRCETHREKFTVAEEHIWQIPGSWGECRVMVEGDTDTSFYLVEVAKGGV